MRRGIAATLGFLIAPLASAMVLAICTFIGDRFRPTALLLLPVYSFGTGTATIIDGLPLSLILLTLNRVNRWTVLPSGTSIGALAWVAIRLSSLTFRSRRFLSWRAQAPQPAWSSGGSGD